MGFASVDSVSKYQQWTEALDRIRYYEYVNTKLLAQLNECLCHEDCSVLAYELHQNDCEIAELKKVTPV